MPLLYETLADWWPLFSPPADYIDEAADLRSLILEERPDARTLLELGSGGGNIASHWKDRFALTLVEPSAGMRARSVALNPEAEHLAGDMRTFRDARRFDAVLVHDAVCYMTTEADLAAAIRTAAQHVRPSGVVLFAPNQLRDTFTPSTDHGGEDGDGRAIRWVEWVHDPDPDDTTYIADYGLLLRDANGEVRAVHDRHLEGLFPRATWLRLLADAGLEARAVTDRWERELFVARRPE